MRFDAPGVVSIGSEPEAVLGEGEVRLRTLYSGISAGTELTYYRGTNRYLEQRWDSERRLLVAGEAQFPYPVSNTGYEEVGTVVEVGPGVSNVRVGQRVWGTWGHRSSAVVAAEHAAARVLPDDADPLIGVFSHIGAVGLNVVLDADLHVGETVAVFGLGVLGQIVAQLARLNGARVVGVDLIPPRLALATELGADVVLDAGEGEVAERIRSLTGGRGADVSIEVSGNARALHEAIRSVAYSSRVVAAGLVPGDAVGLRLGEEFHLNRVSVVSSQISGVAPALAHRWDRYRLNTTVLGLAIDGRLRLRPLVSHIRPLADAAAMFDLLDRTPNEALQVVLSFDDA
jgi:threonine dehydrogenase-like Zn-dependent dehydrogenase